VGSYVENGGDVQRRHGRIHSQRKRFFEVVLEHIANAKNWGKEFDGTEGGSGSLKLVQTINPSPAILLVRGEREEHSGGKYWDEGLQISKKGPPEGKERNGN